MLAANANYVVDVLLLQHYTAHTLMVQHTTAALHSTHTNGSKHHCSITQHTH